VSYGKQVPHILGLQAVEVVAAPEARRYLLSRRLQLEYRHSCLLRLSHSFRSQGGCIALDCACAEMVCAPVLETDGQLVLGHLRLDQNLLRLPRLYHRLCFPGGQVALGCVCVVIGYVLVLGF
jgi:hypothetical protein